MKRLLLASRNNAKIKQFKERLADLPIEIVSLHDVGITDDVVEDQPTYERNALKKALFYHQRSCLPVLADDSGFEIMALNNEPGVKSRRWPGHEATDEELISMVLEKTKHIPQHQRTAKYVSVIVLCLGPEEYYSERAELHGEVGSEPRGNWVPGFPFDSVFWLPDIGKYITELTTEEKEKYNLRLTILDKLKEVIRTKV